MEPQVTGRVKLHMLARLTRLEVASAPLTIMKLIAWLVFVAIWLVAGNGFLVWIARTEEAPDWPGVTVSVIVVNLLAMWALSILRRDWRRREEVAERYWEVYGLYEK